MLDQAVQFAQIGFCQFGDGLHIVAFGAEGPAQHQLTAIHLTVDAQLVGQRRVWIVCRADRLIERTEQRITAEALIELAQVVEGDRRHRQRSHGLTAQAIGQITQHAIT